jgi:hypothetical protein
MNIIITDRTGTERITIREPRTFSCKGSFLHLNKQPNGTWHFLYGERPVPHFGLLKAIEFTNFDGNTADVEFNMHANSMRRKAFLVFKKAAHPYIQIEEDLDGKMTVYVTDNFKGALFPQCLRWEA